MLIVNANWGVAQLAECLPSMLKALDLCLSLSSGTKNNPVAHTCNPHTCNPHTWEVEAIRSQTQGLLNYTKNSRAVQIH